MRSHCSRGPSRFPSARARTIEGPGGPSIVRLWPERLLVLGRGLGSLGGRLVLEGQTEGREVDVAVADLLEGRQELGLCAAAEQRRRERLGRLDVDLTVLLQPC